ncbi:Uncharacterised protein [Serratia ficaria]|uniref:hypothetical protein n=1 Tax=Serratia ficaria TaxID=61651 RepID=UPI0021790F4F|nr:hypothetical protein [Serratia ficaria]CAI1709711.1 Uncharacterised protein [Serratia ficaria]
MSNHYFYALPPLTLKSSLLLLTLTAPVLLGIQAEREHQRALSTQLANEQRQLLAHQQAAEAIRARQRAFSAAPTGRQPSPPRLAVLAKLTHAWKDDIALLSLDLDARQQRMRLELASQSLDSLLDFVSRLQQTPAKVGLENHARDRSLPPPWQIRATLNLEYDHAP